MTDPSVGVSRLTLATRCKDAVTSARGTRTAAAPRSVTDRITGYTRRTLTCLHSDIFAAPGVRMPAAEARVERMPTVRL